LATDYSASPIPDLGWLFFRYTFYLTCKFALLASLLLLRYLHIHDWRLVIGAIVIALAASGIIAALCSGLKRLLISTRERRYARQHRDEALRESERFYYLAVWAALTGRAKFGRRMLAQARLMGFSDPTRLNDKTVTQVDA
jgi:hypothetical protein